MKKILLTTAFVALASVSAKAFELPSLGIFSLTGGIAQNESVWGGKAKQSEFTEAGAAAATRINSENGVFTAGYNSQFVELGIGRFITLGYEHTPDSITSPQNINDGAHGITTAKVSVDFNDLNTTYVKLNTPLGIYFKTGSVSTDIDIKETMGSGNTYKNTSVDGTMIGTGYQTFLGESGFGVRVEATYIDLDNVSVNNGILLADGTPANGGRAEVDATNLEGLVGKVALTYTFGRN